MMALLVDQFRLSRRRACRAVGLSRAAWYRPPVEARIRDAPVIDALNGLVAQHSRWAFWKCDDRLRLDGARWNHRKLWWVGTSLPAARVVRMLDQLTAIYGQPNALRLDNGPEITSVRFTEWGAARRIGLKYIQPGHPAQNAFIERFNRAFREEVLGAYLFESVEEVRASRTGGSGSTTSGGRTGPLAACRPCTFDRGQSRGASLRSPCLPDGGAYRISRHGGHRMPQSLRAAQTLLELVDEAFIRGRDAPDRRVPLGCV
jgi:transposase InsO family protein